MCKHLLWPATCIRPQGQGILLSSCHVTYAREMFHLDQMNSIMWKWLISSIFTRSFAPFEGESCHLVFILVKVVAFIKEWTQIFIIIVTNILAKLSFVCRLTSIQRNIKQWKTSTFKMTRRGKKHKRWICLRILQLCVFSCFLKTLLVHFNDAI